MHKAQRAKTTKNPNKNRTPLPHCPSADVINVIQVQLFDNGSTPVQGRSRFTVKLEVYCEGRLNLYKPYWARTVSLIDPSRVMDWADDTFTKGDMTAEQRHEYASAYEVAQDFMQIEDAEWAKMGHIGAKRENTRYIGQFVLMMKMKDGPINFVIFIDGERLVTTSFLYDQHWRPGSKRRKFFGFYDPHGMYEQMQREEAMKADAEARTRARGSHSSSPAADPFSGYISRSPF